MSGGTRVGASVLACWLTAACGGGSRDVPVSPTGPGGGAPAAVAAPTIVSPADDSQMNTLRPTLTIANVSGSGSRTYEFQIADNAGFAIVPGRIARFVVAYTQSGVPEGSGGQTSLTVPSDLLPTTRYYWRARALQGTAVGAWSATSRFRTRVESFKSGNTVYDHILDNGRTIADLQRNIVFIDDQSPGMKLDDKDSYLGYRISPLPEGEVSFVAVRIKPTGDRSFTGQSKVLTMQDGIGGPLSGNAHRVLVDRFWDTGQVRFEFRSGNGGGSADSTGQSWQDHFGYLVKLEWRAGTARLRIFNGDTEGAATKVDLTTTYTAPYNPSSHTVVIGSLHGDSMRDMRVSRIYIGPGTRPASLGSAAVPD